jgi:hypothetical protein
MLFPACTGTGLAALLIERLAESATPTVADALLLLVLGSVVTLLATEAVSTMAEPALIVGLTVTKKVKVVEPVAARLAMVQVYGAVVVQVQPLPDKDENVVPVGSVSVSVTVLAAAGPLLVTTCV